MITSQELTKIWDNSHENIPLDKDFSRYAESQKLASGLNTCDLGGGTGADTIFFAKQGHRVALYDISPLALSRAQIKSKELGLKIKTVQSDFGSDWFTLPVNAFDFLYSRLALHYFPSAQLAHILAKIYSSLKESGKAKITLKSPVDEKEMEFLKSTSVELEPGVFSEEGQIKTRFDLAQLKAILQKTGIPESSYSVAEISEDLGGRTDAIKSGNKVMVLNEITITK